MDLFASLFFSPGILPDFFLRHGWRNTRGGQDGRESCAHTGMAQHTRKPLIGSSRVADSAEKKAAHRWLQAEKCDFGEIQELSFKIFI